MAFSVRGGSGAISDINVTPLVDVMLVLLIIFMITATLARPIDEQERLVEMNLPATRDTPQQVTSEDDKPILRIDERLTARIDDVVLVDCSEGLTRRDRRRFEPCFERFQSALLENERVMTRGEVYILADPVIPYGFVVGILHRIGEAGVPKVGMVTNPEYLRLAADPASPEESDR